MWPRCGVRSARCLRVVVTPATAKAIIATSSRGINTLIIKVLSTHNTRYDKPKRVAIYALMTVGGGALEGINRAR